MAQSPQPPGGVLQPLTSGEPAEATLPGTHRGSVYVRTATLNRTWAPRSLAPGKQGGSQRSPPGEPSPHPAWLQAKAHTLRFLFSIPKPMQWTCRWSPHSRQPQQISKPQKVLQCSPSAARGQGLDDWGPRDVSAYVQVGKGCPGPTEASLALTHGGFWSK